MEKLEQQPKKERNLEQDRLNFVEVLNSSSVEEIETEFDEQSVDSLVSDLKETRLFLLGETHGVKENPDIIYTLFRKFGFKNLALEWDKGLQEEARKFLETGELDFTGIKDSRDGRITAGHFALLKKLKEEGLLETLICFDEESPSGEWDVRDANRAKNILVNLSENPTLVIAGNLHTEVKPVTFKDEKEPHHPMGENVKKQIPNVPSGKIKYLTGQFHNFGVREFRKRPEGELPKAKFYKSAEGVYIFKLPEAHVAIVPNPAENRGGS